MAINWLKPLPRWGGEVIEPPEAKKDEGWIAGDKPPAKWWNWYMKWMYEAVNEQGGVIEGLDTQLAQIEEDLSEHKIEVISQVIPINRDISLTGVQIVTLPFKAKSITIIAAVNTEKRYSTGIWAENDVQRCVRINADTGIAQIITNAISIATTATVVANGTIQNVTDTGFEINWTKTGTPTGTASISISASTH